MSFRALPVALALALSVPALAEAPAGVEQLNGRWLLLLDASSDLRPPGQKNLELVRVFDGEP